MKTTIIIIIFIVIDAVLIALVYRVYSILLKAHGNRAGTALSRDRLIYIRKIIDTVYTHQNNAERLQKRIIELTKSDVLLAYHVVMPPNDTVYDKVDCNEADKLLCKLADMGFTPRELCMLFSLNNINSVYVKMSRMNKRLKEAEEEPMQHRIGQ